MIDSERFGGRRAYLSHLAARALSVAGAYRGLLDVDWSSVGRLVFVCKGNICRSPYAEARARSLGIDAVSFGLDAAGGAGADASATRNARLRRLDLSAHRSRRVDGSLLQPKDLVLLFEPQQVEQFRERFGSTGVAVTLAGLWAKPERPYLCDPYGRSDVCFQDCFSVIDASVAAVSARLQKLTIPVA
jgi:protein-tyrosine phosphatase